MKMTIQRAALLKPLQIISGVVEKRQTLPILANVLMTIDNNKLSLTATDLEIELIGTTGLTEAESGRTTVSARKLLDICRALPDEALLQFALEEGQLVLRSGKSRFLLTTLPADDFPVIPESPFTTEMTMTQQALKNLLSRVYFAMGQQDVRHYLNGALLDIHQGVMKCVATDGHRLAFSSIYNEDVQDVKLKVIVPRKSVLELMRLLDGNNTQEVKVCFGEQHCRVISPDFVFTSKLISAQYPDYDRLIPRSVENTVVASREALKQALTRASILSNERFRGIRFQLDKDMLRIVANNPEQEEAEELIHLQYQGDGMEIGFNAAYLLDVVSALSSKEVCCSFNDPNAGVLIASSEEDKKEKEECLYVVMPMRL